MVIKKFIKGLITDIGHALNDNKTTILNTISVLSLAVFLIWLMFEHLRLFMCLFITLISLMYGISLLTSIIYDETNHNKYPYLALLWKGCLIVLDATLLIITPITVTLIELYKTIC